jgi:hypothetical protein
MDNKDTAINLAKLAEQLLNDRLNDLKINNYKATVKITKTTKTTNNNGAIAHRTV